MITPDKFFELKDTLDSMRQVSHTFYQSAIAIGNHPFIEFTGLINEYIKLCEECFAMGIDFSQCNIHAGNNLPISNHSIDYIEEKLECIFQDSVSLNSYQFDYPDW